MYKWRTFLIVGCIVFVAFQIFMFTSPHITLKRVRESFAGRVDSIYFSKVTHYVIKQNNGNELSIVGSSDTSFYNDVKVGDSIYKQANDVYCYKVNDDGSSNRYFYVTILRRERNDFRWPKAWKNKWPEATK